MDVKGTSPDNHVNNITLNSFKQNEIAFYLFDIIDIFQGGVNSRKIEP
jgi:hypothetical protein